MKTIKILSLAAFMAFSFSLAAQDFTVDTQKSSVKWLGTKVTGKHFGKISIKSGEMTVKDNKISAGTFVIDMNTIVCDDIEDAGTNQKLVGHLKSDDFFGVAKFPEAKLVVTRSTAFKNNTADVRGDFTIKGKTNSILFTVTKSGDKYLAKITVDRSKFDIRYGSNSFFDNLGDKAISDDFTLDVDLVVNKK
jgi:polyisoprenoid-binding protein YceI